MKYIAKHLIHVICIIAIIAGILLIIKDITNENFGRAIRCSALMVSYAIFSSVNLLYNRKLSIEIKVKYNLKKLLKNIYFVILILAFCMSVISNNFIISNACSGLIFPSTYFFINQLKEQTDSSINYENKD